MLYKYICVFLFKQKTKIHVLEFAFLIIMLNVFNYCHGCHYTIYNLYRIFIVIILYIFALLININNFWILLHVDNPDDFTNNLYMILNVSVSDFKLIVT